MSTVWALVKRNMKVYLKNRSNVFFSFLSMLIILILNTVFLGGINEDHLKEMVSLSDKTIAYVTGSWLMAGIIVVNTFMVTTVMLNIMVEDEEKHKLAAFIAAPVSKITLTVSYILSACLTSFCFAIITLGFSQVYLYTVCGKLLPLMSDLKILGLAAANIFSVVSIIMCAATFMKSTSAYGAFNTTMGTLIGFIAAIYLPMGSLPENVQKALKFFPVLHGTAAVREIYTQDAISTAFAGAPDQLIEGYKKYMGISIYFGDEKVNMLMSLLILIGSGIIFTIVASLLLNKKQASDR